MDHKRLVSTVGLHEFKFGLSVHHGREFFCEMSADSQLTALSAATTVLMVFRTWFISDGAPSPMPTEPNVRSKTLNNSLEAIHEAK